MPIQLEMIRIIYVKKLSCSRLKPIPRPNGIIMKITWDCQKGKRKIIKPLHMKSCSRDQTTNTEPGNQNCLVRIVNAYYTGDRTKSNRTKWGFPVVSRLEFYTHRLHKIFWFKLKPDTFKNVPSITFLLIVNSALDSYNNRQSYILGN